MRMKILAAAAAVTIAGSAQALTTIDFSGTTANVGQTSFSEGGLDFGHAGGGYFYVWDGTSPNANGTNNLIFADYGAGDLVTISKTGGGAFKLISADIVVSWYSGVSPNTILVNGTPLVIDTTLTTYTFNTTGTAFTLSGLASNDGYWSLDNVVFGTVPEPATWALMIGGFAMTGFAARRRRTAVAA